MARYNYYGTELANEDELMEFYYENEELAYLEDILRDYDISVILQYLDGRFLAEIREEAKELYMERVKVIDDDEEEEGEE